MYYNLMWYVARNVYNVKCNVKTNHYLSFRCKFKNEIEVKIMKDIHLKPGLLNEKSDHEE